MNNSDLLDEIRIIQGDVKKLLVDVSALKARAAIFGGVLGGIGGGLVSLIFAMVKG